VINEVLESNLELEYDDVKRAILTVIYGGTTAYRAIKNKTEWLIEFKKEIDRLHKKVPEWFPEEFALQKQIKEDGFNLEGAALSASVCVVEDRLLDIMVQFLKAKKYIDKTAVLTFDGIMVPKDAFKDDNNKMLQAMRHIEKLFQEAGYDIKIKTKEFDTLPMDVPEEFAVEVKTESPQNEYCKSGYYWMDFMKDMNQVHDSHTALCTVFKKNINKVMLRIYEMDDFIVRKISQQNMFHFDKKIPKDVFKFWDVKPDGSPFINSTSLTKLLVGDGLISEIKCYNKLEFDPSETNGDERNFNSWTGFQAKLLPKEEVNVTLIAPILNHIKKVWCDDSEELYRYVLSWFHVIFMNPSFKSRVALVLHSHEKQIGKGVLITEFLIPYVFGRKYAMSTNGLDTPTGKFNEIMMNKIFVNCDELSALEGSYHQLFDTMKKRITDNSIMIEIKGGKKFEYRDCTNYIMCTNNDFTIKIETGDPRYCVLQCSPIYKGQFGYFKELVNSHFNETAADHFFSYIYHMEDAVEVRNIPMTQLKRDMIIAGLSPSQRFLIHLQETAADAEIEWISASELYERFKAWCDADREKPCSQTRFGREIANHIQKRRTGRSNTYSVSSINISL
jgi:hypothetical protein